MTTSPTDYLHAPTPDEVRPVPMVPPSRGRTTGEQRRRETRPSSDGGAAEGERRLRQEPVRRALPMLSLTPPPTTPRLVVAGRPKTIIATP
jgi:hypothetical protein